MKFAASLLLAFRFLFPSFSPSSHKKERPSSARRSLFASVCCVGLSLVPLIVVLSVSDGMIDGMTKRIVELSSFHLQAIQFTVSGDAEKDKTDLRLFAKNIAGLPGVQNVYLERTGSALATGKTARSGVALRAVEQSLLTQNESFRTLFTVHEGVMDFTDEKSAVIGKALADKTALTVGDTIRLITMQTTRTGKIVPRPVSFTVSGIVSCGYRELDSLWVFVPFDTGFDMLSSNVSRVFIGVNTADAFSPDLYRVAQSVRKEVGLNFGVFTWEELNESQYANFRTSKMLLLFIMILIVLVASVNITAALIMLVIEERKEIAILKSMGASPSGISTAFVLAGFFTGLGGVLVGFPLALVCSINVNEIIRFIEKLVNVGAHFVYSIGSAFSEAQSEFVPLVFLDPAFYLTDIEFKLPFTELFCIVSATLVLSVFASLVPALKAGKEKPLETLRKF